MPVTRIAISFLLVLFAQFALADVSLDDAKARGLVGEDASGYLAAVESAPNRDVRTLVSTVNGKRSAQYKRIAQTNNITATDVEQLAGKKAIEKTRPGHYIRLPGHDWQKK